MEEQHCSVMAMQCEVTRMTQSLLLLLVTVHRCWCVYCALGAPCAVSEVSPSSCR